MSLSEAQNTLATMFLMLGMEDVKHFETSSGVKYVAGTLRGKRYLFSHRLNDQADSMGYILSVDDDIRIATYDPKLIADAIKLLLRDNNATIPKSIISEIEALKKS